MENSDIPIRRRLISKRMTINLPRIADQTKDSAPRADMNPWWIQREELHLKNEIIKRLEDQVAHQLRTLEQHGVQQHCDRVRTMFLIETLQKELLSRDQRIKELEEEVRKHQFNGELLRGLHRRMELFEYTMIPLQTTNPTSYTVVQLSESNDKEEWLDPDALTGETNV